MSILDTQAYIFSSTVTKNIIPTKHQGNIVKYTQWITLAMLIILGGVATTIGDSLEFIFKAASISFVLVPSFLFNKFSWFKAQRYYDYTTSGAIIIGLGVYGYMFMNGAFAQPLNTVFPPLVVAGSFVVLSCISAFLPRR